MKRLSFLLLLLTLTAIISGCTPLGELRKAAEHDRGDFNSSLTQEYLAFAESEYELGHRRTSKYFAEKGLKASRGETVLPEDPKNRTLGNGIREELTNARQRLMNVRNDFIERVANQHIARSQLLYDCWVVQAERKADNDPNLPCRQEFMEELLELEGVDSTPEPAPEPERILPAHFTLLFPSGGTHLTKDGLYAIQQILDITRRSAAYDIELIGHTDRVGSREDNLALSTARATSVAIKLVENGVPEETISIQAEGEDNPSIPTLDGIAQPRNRRVEVWVLEVHEVPGIDAERQETIMQAPINTEGTTAPKEENTLAPLPEPDAMQEQHLITP